jgi:hypothetical protein
MRGNERFFPIWIPGPWQTTFFLGLILSVFKKIIMGNIVAVSSLCSSNSLECLTLSRLHGSTNVIIHAEYFYYLFENFYNLYSLDYEILF